MIVPAGAVAKKKRVWFFVDAGEMVGLGHLTRCRALAGVLARFAEVQFYCLLSGRSTSGVTTEFELDSFTHAEVPLSRFKETFSNTVLHERPDALVVDSYLLSESELAFLRELAPIMLAIDDQYRTSMSPDILLNQNLLGRDDDEGRTLYRGLVPQACQLLLGPKYALLREQFTLTRNSQTEEERQILLSNAESTNLLISFGGADPTGETEKVLEAYGRSPRRGWTVTVLPLLDSKRMSALRTRYGSIPGVFFSPRVDDMAGLLRRTSIAFGAAGSSVWERAAMGVPSYVIQSAANQGDVVEGIRRTGLAIFLGDGAKTSTDDWHDVLNLRLQSDRIQWPQLARLGMELVDGRGAFRVASLLVERLGVALS